MKYQVLRDCYVGERLYRKGEVREVADALAREHPKNFRLVGMSEEAAEDVLNEGHEQKLKEQEKREKAAVKALEKKEAAEAKAAKAAELPSRFYFCTKTQCQKRHLRTGKTGKAHKKYERKED